MIICCMKGASASWGAPRLLNTPTKVSTEEAAAVVKEGWADGREDGGLGGGLNPSTGSGGCTRAVGGGGGGDSCGAGVGEAGVGEGAGGGGGVAGGRGAAAGVKWTAVER